jgi:hypothetical protein
MRLSEFFTAKSTRAIVGGAVLALGLVGTGLANADATTWSTQTKDSANFTCVSNDCKAGGVGHVNNGDVVAPSADGQVGPGGGIGKWARTLNIQCKADTLGSGREYHGSVSGKNWDGQWSVLKSFLAKPIDDSGIPWCR